jgi:hypothetical protein
MTLGIDIGKWISAVIAMSGTASAEVAGSVPVLDPGPLASVLALMVAGGLMWHQRRRSPSAR